MKNFIHEGRTCTFVAPYDVQSGQGFQVGSMFAVANTNAAQGAEVEGDCIGVFELNKSNAAGSAAAAGTKLFWDNVARQVTKTPGGLFIGHLRRDVADADITLRIRLHGAPA